MVVDEHGADRRVAPLEQDAHDQRNECGGAEDPGGAAPIVGNEHPVEQRQKRPGGEHVTGGVDGGDGVVVRREIVKEARRLPEESGRRRCRSWPLPGHGAGRCSEPLSSGATRPQLTSASNTARSDAEPEHVALEEVDDDSEGHDADQNGDGCQEPRAQQTDRFVAESCAGSGYELDGFELGGGFTEHEGSVSLMGRSLR